MFVTFEVFGDVRDTADATSTVDSIISPTLPAAALSFVVVPIIPLVELNVIEDAPIVPPLVILFVFMSIAPDIVPPAKSKYWESVEPPSVISLPVVPENTATLLFTDDPVLLT